MRAGPLPADRLLTPAAPATGERGDSRPLPGPSAGGAARTFRLFVSSTFDDFELERDILRERVWPRLERFCEQWGARFEAVDLRWGVGSEAAADQQTMNICLGEIERCHRVTPRPNFFILLGDHYGWRPLPPQIAANEFDALAAYLAAEDRVLAEAWYERDDNARPPWRRLRPQDEAWAEVEGRLHAALQKAAEDAGLEERRLRVYRTSATEQEIVAGALEAADPDQVVCVLRRIDVDPSWATAMTPAEAEQLARFVDADPEPAGALRAELKARLAARILCPSDDAEPGTAFTMAWGDPAAQLDYLNLFAERVAGELEASIGEELREPRHQAGQTEAPPRRLPADDFLDAGGRAHRDFAEDRIQFFTGRQDELARIDRYVDDDVPQPLAVTGGGGTGKSALIGEAVRRTLQRYPGALVVYRFIGATAGSSNGRTLLDGVCRELARRSGQPEQDVPPGFADLIADFRRRLEPAAGRRACVFIDSLDQLGAADGARGLAWIPSQLPSGARLVVSTRPGETLDRISSRAEPISVPPLPVTDGRAALEAWLGNARRTLHEAQSREVLDAFERSEGNPLYLRLAFEEARRWPFPEPADRAHQPLAVAAGGGTTVVEPIIRGNLLARLEAEHGAVLVAHALGYLAASRHGLAETELTDLLSADPDVYRWFLLTSYHLPADLVALATRHPWTGETPAAEGPLGSHATARQWLSDAIGTARQGTDGGRLDGFLGDVLGHPEGPKLPAVLWSRLFFDLQPYLAERQVEDVNALDFYHRELRDVASAQYAAEEQGRLLHQRLARYFRSRADPGGDGTWQDEIGRADRRGLAELPYHLTHAERWDDLSETLIDFRFLEQKAANVGVIRAGTDGEPALYAGVFQLQDDYDTALRVLPGAAKRTAGRLRLIVTATDFGDGLTIRCPHCNTAHFFSRECPACKTTHDLGDWKGKDIDCANAACHGALAVNDFLAGGGRTDDAPPN